MFYIEKLSFSSSSLLVKFTSYILGQNEEYHEALESMVSAVTPTNSKWTRCYHARSDGSTAHAFHSRCDNKGPTITLVQVREFIFGGFLDQNWGGNNVTLNARNLVVQAFKISGDASVEAGKLKMRKRRACPSVLHCKFQHCYVSTSKLVIV